MARIHLTGAGGYIGAALRRRLVNDGHEVEVADYRLPDSSGRRIKADFLVHLAAAGGGSHHLKRAGDADPAQMHAVNVRGLESLLDRLADRETKAMFLSSKAVYRAPPSSPLVDEASPIGPTSAYGASKAAAERILRDSSFDFMILRPCGVFGESVARNFGNAFLNVVIDHAVREGRLTIMGGDQGIDSLYLSDLVEVVARSCAGEWKSGATYNVAGDVVTINVLFETLADALARCGRPCAIDRQPQSPRAGVLLDNARIKHELPGWRPTGLDESLFELVRARLSGVRAGPRRGQHSPSRSIL